MQIRDKSPIPGGIWALFSPETITNLRERYSKKRKSKELLERLIANQDFQRWMVEMLHPFVQLLKAQILAGTTKGYQHDLLKGVLNVVETLESGNIEKTVKSLEREMDRIDRMIQNGGFHAIDS